MGRRPLDRHERVPPEAAAGNFAAKDFRTWNTTVLAAASLAILGERARSATARKRVVSLAVSEVAHYLGNTPTVCRHRTSTPA